MAKPLKTERKTKLRPTDLGRRKLTRRPGKLSPKKRAKFLELYASGNYTVRRAARKLGFTGVAVFSLCRRDEEFKAKFDSARETSVDALEDSLHDLACRGNVTAIFGLLKARRPKVWRENMHVSGNVEHNFSSEFAAAMSRATAKPTEHVTH
jgi:hypothetical protein